MDYKRIYDNIISRAKIRVISGYTESHHILPRCMGGNDTKENIVKLTAREHFLCHMLLCEIYPQNYKLKHALFLMAIGKQKIKPKKYVISSRVYERLREEYSQILTGKKQSKKTKQKKSKSMIEVWNKKSNKEKIEISNKIWETRKKNGTDKPTNQQIQNISKALKGRKINWDRKVSKIIEQYSLEGIFIREWDSINEAMRKGYGDVRGCLLGRQKTAGGYIWKYKK